MIMPAYGVSEVQVLLHLIGYLREALKYVATSVHSHRKASEVGES
jgi:hypothetical protein